MLLDVDARSVAGLYPGLNPAVGPAAVLSGVGAVALPASPRPEVARGVDAGRRVAESR